MIKKVDVYVVAPVITTLETETGDGLRYAVVYKQKKLIALFESRYWAEHFIANSEEAEFLDFRLMKVV
jgi:hypothetical protein